MEINNEEFPKHFERITQYLMVKDVTEEETFTLLVMLLATIAPHGAEKWIDGTLNKVRESGMLD